MRARPDEQIFSAWLMNLGNGTEPTKPNTPYVGAIKMPNNVSVPSNQSLINVIYNEVEPNQFSSRVILTPRNTESLKINEEILLRLPGDIRTYYSADDVQTDDEDERALYPVEFLNSLTPSGMPPHCLNLKIGAVVMLLRNIDLKSGLCNGTRLRVVELGNNIVRAEVITGAAEGTLVLIPRIQLCPSDTGMPFILRRRQFPLRLAYSMTINKAQGQTFEKVGLYLQRPCFSHGQLYVAASRSRAFNDLKVLVSPTSKQGYLRNGDCYTQNIVFRQILN